MECPLSEFFDLTHDERRLALNYPRDHTTAESLQQMTLLQSAIFDIGDIERAIAVRKNKRPGEFASLSATPSA
jgi:enoyl-CoA hydratase